MRMQLADPQNGADKDSRSKTQGDALAAICTLELGNPFIESLVTAGYGISFLSQLARVNCDTHAGSPMKQRYRHGGQAYAVIAPLNSPITMTRQKVSSSIAAGNTVVCKPAPETLLCTTALG